MSASISGLNASNANLAAPGDPIIRKREIQGDVLVGLQKDEEHFLFFKIVDVARFKAALRDYIIAEITTTEEVLSREIQIKAYKASGRRSRLPFVGLNIGFSNDGLSVLLGANGTDGMDASFVAGAGVRAAGLLDPVDANGKPDWLAAFASDTIHGVLLVTGPAASASAAKSPAQKKVDDIVNVLGHSIKLVYRDVGVTRPQRGHEHFGFLDGVSNPGVRGITPRDNPADDNQGVPGQDLLWPGAFVFGYPGQDPNQPFEKPGAPPAMAHPWMADGSYMVFRRLNQFVPEFHNFLQSEGRALGIDPQLVGARMVGRWQSGAPIMIAPLQDDPALGADPKANNNFEFSQDTGERRCPFAAHIRKTYPRDDLEDPNKVGLLNPEGFVQAHRIMRAGIPFGPEVAEDEEKTKHERGLMFVCYQTSIIEQFEFIQISWANATGFPINKVHPDKTPATPGHDPIIGQAKGARAMDEILPNYPMGDTRSTLNMPDAFVKPSAAGYFFVPSISALRNTLAHP
ncbi:Dyp-type peroxidase [Bradyrhizobium sp. BR 10289]|uniref:Dyp-type peroxidase n=1 Tax=Bradyrhizobium sp. BR 10289 TaxID=2749993 RepID=UPI001C65205D|nr:Dyp-type peroxidase [Bradyrhizobium sp. BR 10289]MBW7971199.1 Dyp-type peroxidase [Bradyrhizobium sp. BR 10289]